MTARVDVMRRHRHGERGLTLIELLVTVTILTIVGAAIGVAFDVGIRVMGNGGAKDRLIGGHDVSVAEQLIAQDVSRSACIAQQTGGTYHTYGSCAHQFANASVTTACKAALVCSGWPQVSDLSCHVAAYATSAGQLRRYEYAASPAGTFSHVNDRAVTTGAATITIASLSPTLAPGGYSWIPVVSITVTATGVALNQPGGTLVVRPLSVDPAAGAASIGSGAPPC